MAVKLVAARCGLLSNPQSVLLRAMTRRRRLRTSGLLAATLCFSSLSLRAQEIDDAARGAARKLGYEGVASFQAGDYASATEKLNKAYRILHAPSLGLWSARALEKSGKLVEAAERYREVILLHSTSFDSQVQAQALSDAQHELTLLEPRIPYVTVQVSGAAPSDVTLTIDEVGVSSELIGVARPINPGTHRVVGVRGQDRVELNVTCAEGSQCLSPLSFKPLPEPSAESAAPVAVPVPKAPPIEPKPASNLQEPPAPPMPERPAAHAGGAQRAVAWVALGLGAGALTVGGVTGVGAMLQRRKLDDRTDCKDTVCYTSAQSTVHDYNQLRKFSTIGLWAGGGLLATSIVLLASSPSPSRTQVGVALRLGPSGAAFIGRF